jgi:hypothetical protein
VLKQDGSPPLYYMLLGLWIRAFGDGERATHLLSVIFALACIPLVYFAGRSVFNRTTGIVAAILVALDPFLTYYAQETPMYTIEAFLSIIVARAHVQGILRGSRWWCVGWRLADGSLTHNWAPSLRGAGGDDGGVAQPLEVVRAAALGVAVLYAPGTDAALPGAAPARLVDAAEPSRSRARAWRGAAERCAVHGNRTRRRHRARGLRASPRRPEAHGDPLLGLSIAFTVVLAWFASQITWRDERYFAVIFGALI